MLAAPPALANTPTLLRRSTPRPGPVPAWRARGPAQDAAAVDEEPSLVCSQVQTEEGPVPVQFGRYRLLGIAGSGGMSALFVAHDPLLDMPVAIKRLRPERLSSPVARDWLVHEARVAQRLAHPGVVRVHGLGEHEGELFLTMEYVPGRSLSALVDGAGPLPLADVLALGCALADALQHVHEAGIVHCDLKPDNVVIGDDGRVVLVDFGIAQPMGYRSHRGGTPGYMAPEQTMGLPVDARTDVFGLGAVLHAVLVGPSIEDPSAWQPRGAHPGLERLLARCLSADPSQRPASMAALGRQLRALHQELVPDPPARRWAGGAPGQALCPC